MHIKKTPFRSLKTSILLMFIAINCVLLGNATTYASNPPEFCGFNQVTAGYTSFALSKDGTVWAWGQNNLGQLGNGTTDSSSHSTPAQVPGLSGITAISSQGYFILALKNDGTIWSWGSNAGGQLGYSTSPDNYSATPTQVSSLSNVSKIYAGFVMSFAVKNDGSVWSWGQNNNGQLGNGNTTNSSTPSQILTGISISSIGPGTNHVLAVTTAGNVYSWGLNDNNQLGYSTSPNGYSSTPTVISGLSNVTQAVASGAHSVILLSDQTVKAWGYNFWGQLGDGSNTNRSTPVQVHGLNNSGFLTGITSISAGTSYTLALNGSGVGYAWGLNANSQLGTAPGNTNYPATITAVNSSLITSISASDQNSAATLSNNKVNTWGYNVYGAGSGEQSLTCISPTSGSTQGNQTVSISGSNFVSGATVTFGGTEAIGVNYIDSYNLTATTPLHASGLSDITITNPDLQSATLSNNFTFVSSPWTLASVSPSVSPSAGGGTITISGSGFWQSYSGIKPTITIGGNLATNVSVIDANTLTATIPAYGGSLPAVLSVTVSNPDGSANTLNNAFIYSNTPAPTISSVNPPSGPVTGGNEITISGTNFVTGASVTIDGYAATNITVVSSTSITATAPAYWYPFNPATVNLVVTNPDTQSVTVLYYYYLQPTISSVSPNSIPLEGGTTVYIYGSHFTNDTAKPQVFIGATEVSASDVYYDNDGTIHFIAPAHSAGSVDVQILNDNGGSATLANGLTYAVTPQINSITPNQGANTGNINITLNGTNLDNVTNLYIGSTEASITNVSSNSITATIPTLIPPASSGPVDVTVVDGISSTSSTLTGGFTYNYPPIFNESIGFTKVSSNFITALGLKSDGTVWGWGSSDGGQLGFHNNWPAATSTSTPFQIGNFSQATDVASGRFHSLILDNGQVWSLGDNYDGQLGDGTVTLSTSPVKVIKGLGLGDLNNVTSIASGQEHSLAIIGDNVWSWGNNGNGQLGYESSNYSDTANQIGGLSNVTAVAAGNFFSLALKSDGSVWAWGMNNKGQTGQGNTTAQNTPVEVKTGSSTYLQNIVAIAAGQSYALALDGNGNVYSWGYSYNTGYGFDTGVLGYDVSGTSYYKAYATQIPSLSGVQAIAAGRFHGEALINGEVWTWGANESGELGNGNTNDYTPHFTPLKIDGLTSMTGLSAGRLGGMALQNGKLFAWGSDWYGELGNGDASYTDQFTPVETINYYSPDPAISLDNGSASGGDTTVLSGFNFLSGATVTFGTTPSSSVIVMGLGNSAIVSTPAHTAGTVDVTITNPDGQSDILTGAFTYTGTAPTSPDTPAISLNAGNAQVTVQWLAPNDGGSAITSYTIRYGLDSDNCVPSTSNVGCQPDITIISSDPEFTSRSKIITGLTNESVYNFSIIATNDIGSSNPSPFRSVSPTASGGSNSSSSGTGNISIACNSQSGGIYIQAPNAVDFESKTINFSHESNAYALSMSHIPDDLARIRIIDTRGYDPSPTANCGPGFTLSVQSSGLRYVNPDGTGYNLQIGLGDISDTMLTEDTSLTASSPDLLIGNIVHASTVSTNQLITSSADLVSSDEAVSGNVDFNLEYNPLRASAIMQISHNTLQTIDTNIPGLDPHAYEGYIPSGVYTGTITFTLS